VESEVLLDTLKGVRGGEVVKMIFEGRLEKNKNCSVCLNTIISVTYSSSSVLESLLEQHVPFLKGFRAVSSGLENKLILLSTQVNTKGKILLHK
jgi:hypothetical protein